LRFDGGGALFKTSKAVLSEHNVHLITEVEVIQGNCVSFPGRMNDNPDNPNSCFPNLGTTVALKHNFPSEDLGCARQWLTLDQQSSAEMHQHGSLSGRSNLSKSGEHGRTAAAGRISDDGLADYTAFPSDYTGLSALMVSGKNLIFEP